MNQCSMASCALAHWMTVASSMESVHIMDDRPIITVCRLEIVFKSNCKIVKINAAKYVYVAQSTFWTLKFIIIYILCKWQHTFSVVGLTVVRSCIHLFWIKKEKGALIKYSTF